MIYNAAWLGIYFWYHWNVVFPNKVSIIYRTKEFGFIYSLHYLISFQFFLRDNLIICVLFTLRVSLLESSHNATLANSVLGISIALSIESFWIYTACVINKKVQKTEHYSSSQYNWCRLEREGDQVLIPVEHLYLNLMMLIGSYSRIQNVPCWKGNYESIVEVLTGNHIAWF